VNAPLHSPDPFDAHARALHAQALSALPPATLARLRSARHGATRPSRRLPGWMLATACSALLAAGLGLQLHRSTAPTGVAPASPATLAAGAELDEPLDQNPDLYVWLGSEHALAME
jgi:hypothetical protein